MLYPFCKRNLPRLGGGVTERKMILVVLALMLGSCSSDDSLLVADEVDGGPVVEVDRYDFEDQAGVAVDVEGSGAELVARAEALIPDSQPPIEMRVSVGGEVPGSPQVYRNYRGYDYAVYDITGPLCGVVPTLFVDEVAGLLELRVQHPKTDPVNEGCESAEFDFVVGVDFVSDVQPSGISQVRAN